MDEKYVIKLYYFIKKYNKIVDLYKIFRQNESNICL